MKRHAQVLDFIDHQLVSSIRHKSPQVACCPVGRGLDRDAAGGRILGVRFGILGAAGDQRAQREEGQGRSALHRVSS